MSAGSMPQIGLRLTGDVSDLTGKLQQGGQAVSQFGRQAQQDLGKVEMSAKQTAFALRGLPAQFTDIVVSLQSGQRPMTVLLQQGGQIKDMFGGIGPAARAMGGYIAGLVNPLTLAAGAVGLLTYAYLQGSKEQENYTKALILSGNVAGTTSGQLADMAREMGRGSYTQFKAAESLSAMAQSGSIAAGQLRSFSGAAIDWERATGQAISKTVDQFKELEKSPLEASVKLNGEIHHLTLSVYQQIKALEDHGRTLDAARVAQAAYADTLAQRSKQITENNGFLETSWNGVKTAAAKAWDAMLGLGRDKTGSEQLAQLRKHAAELESKGVKLPAGGATSYAEADLARTRQQIALLERLNTVADTNAKAQGEQALAAQRRSEWDKQGLEFATKAQQRKKELDKAEVEGRDLVAKGIITEIDLRTRLNNIKQKYNETTGQGEVAEIKAKIQAQQQYNQVLARQISGAIPLDQPVKPTDAEQKVLKLQQELKTGIMGVARAEKEKALVQAQALVIEEALTRGLERQKQGLIESEGARAKEISSLGDQASKINDVAAGQEMANATFGKSKTAIEQATLAQLKLRMAEADAFDSTDPKYIASLQAKIDAQQRYVDALEKTEYLQASRKLDEDLRAAKEENATLQLEVSLLGLSRQERDKIVAVRRVEVKLAKELADIDKLNLGGGDRADRDREALKDQARANAQIDAANAANKVVLDEWNRTADQINQSLTDALLRGFESGKDFAKNFRDTLKNMFQTLVLRPMIQGVMAPMSGAMGGFMTGSPAGGAAGSGGGSLAGSALGSIFGAGGLGGSMMAGAGWLTGATTLTGSLGAAASLMGTGTMAGLTSGLGMMVGALGPIALGVAAIMAFVQGHGETRVGGQYSGSTLIDNPSGGEINGGLIRQTISTTIETINKTLGQLGSQAIVSVFQSGLEESKNGKGFAYARGALSNGQAFGNWQAEGYMQNRGTMTAEEAASKFGEELKQATLEALQAADVPGKLGEYLRSLGDIEGLTGGALDAAIARVNKALGERQQLEDQYYALTHTDAENLARTRERERDALDESNRARYDEIAALVDQKVAAEQAAQAQQEAAQKAAQAQQDALQRAQQIAQERETLETRLLQLQGNTVELRRRELEKLDPTNRALQEMINQLEDAKDAAKDLGSSLQQNLDSAVSQWLSGEELRSYRIAQIQRTLSAAGLPYTSESIGNATREQIKEVFKELVAIGNTKGAEALLSVSDALLEITQPAEDASKAVRDTAKALQDAGKGIHDYIVELTTGRAGTATPEHLLSNTRANYIADLAKARAGDLEANRRIPQSAQAYIEAQKAYTASGSQTQAVISQVISELSDLPSVKSYEQQSIELLTGLLDTLKLVPPEITSGLVPALKSIEDGLAGGFDKIDTNLNGTLDMTEFAAAFGSLGLGDKLDDVFHILDANGDGQLTKLEAISIKISGLPGLIGSEFAKIDLNGNGITVDELMQAFAGQATDAQLRAIFHLLDTNGDGTITRLEVLATNTGDTNSTLESILTRLSQDSILSYAKADVAWVYNAINKNTGDAVSWLKDAVYWLGINGGKADATNGYLAALWSLATSTGVHIALRRDVGFAPTAVSGWFADGGAFTNGIVTRPTMLAGVGEAGPEAILPLANVGGQLGVRAAAGNADLVREFRALQALAKRQAELIEHLITVQADVGQRSIKAQAETADNTRQLADKVKLAAAQ